MLSFASGKNLRCIRETQDQKKFGSIVILIFFSNKTNKKLNDVDVQ